MLFDPDTVEARMQNTTHLEAADRAAEEALDTTSRQPTGQEQQKLSEQRRRVDQRGPAGCACRFSIMPNSIGGRDRRWARRRSPRGMGDYRSSSVRGVAVAPSSRRGQLVAALTGLRIDLQERHRCVPRPSRDLGGARAIGHLKQQAGHQVAPEQAQKFFGHRVGIASEKPG